MLFPSPNERDPDRPNRAEVRAPNSEVDWREARELAFCLAVRLCGKDLAEDAAQESMIKLMANLSKIRVGWRPLLYKIVFSVSCTLLKREGRQSFSSASEAQVNNVPDTSPQPATTLQASEDQKALSTCLQILDKKFGKGTRAIVELRYRGTKWQEIADIARLRERACRYRFESATKWLSERLSPPETKDGNDV